MIVSYDRRVTTGGGQARLGEQAPGGVAPAILAIVERGMMLRPGLAAGLRCEVELDMDGYPPVRISFDGEGALVEDGPAQAPDLQLHGSLVDLTNLLVAPLVGGLPNPIRPRGRAALGLVAQRKVRFEGRVALLRRFLSTIRI